MGTREHRSRRLAGLAFSVTVVAMLLVPPARAAAFVVTRFDDPLPGACNPGDCSLREAVRAANMAPGPDEIQLPAGLYDMAQSGPGEQAALTGDLDVEPGGLTLVPQGSVVVTGCQLERLFEVLPGAGLTLSGITLSGSCTATFGLNGGTILNQGDLTLAASFLGGLGGNGGGLYNQSGTAFLDNVTISGAYASGAGGAVANASGATAVLNNVTIWGNTAGSIGLAGGGGGGLWNEGTIVLRNSIVAGNVDQHPTSSVRAPDCAGPVPSAGHNLIEDTTNCDYTAGPGDVTGVDAKVSDQILFGNRGIPAPSIGSPAIDAGDPAPPGSGGSSCAATDQLGRPRPVDGNFDGTDRCDMGALEFTPAPKMVNISATPRRLEKGERTLIEVRVSPCEGHERDVVELYRGKKRIAKKATNDKCKAKKRVRVTRTSRFRAVSPRQDVDHAEGVSKTVKLKVVG